ESQRIARDSSEGVPASDKTAARNPTATRAAAGDTNPGRQALFVVTGADKLVKTFESLRAKRDMIDTWKLDEPIDLASLDSGSQKRVEDAMFALKSLQAGGTTNRTVARANEGNAAERGKSPEVLPLSPSSRRPAPPTSSSERGFSSVASPQVGFIDPP